MNKYVFPAVFRKEKKGYYIYFPDVDACFTQGNDLQDGLDMANDVLCMTLYDMEENGKAIPVPSDPAAIKTNAGEFVTLVGCDTLEYRKFHNSKAVKKTLTVPQRNGNERECELLADLAAGSYGPAAYRAIRIKSENHEKASFGVSFFVCNQ